jgi:hypothetical protein
MKAELRMPAAFTAAAQACRKLFQLREPNTSPAPSGVQRRASAASAFAESWTSRGRPFFVSMRNDTPRAIDTIPGQPERLAPAHTREHRELDYSEVMVAPTQARDLAATRLSYCAVPIGGSSARGGSPRSRAQTA